MVNAALREEQAAVKRVQDPRRPGAGSPTPSRPPPRVMATTLLGFSRA